jgi:hypothetical protein
MPLAQPASIFFLSIAVTCFGDEPNRPERGAVSDPFAAVACGDASWPASDWRLIDPPPAVRGCADCQPGDLMEDEPDCGIPDSFNGGCNGEPIQSTPLSCGQTVCGTGMIQPSPLVRDTDWYSITLEQRKRLRWRVTTAFSNGANLWIMPAQCPSTFFTAGLVFRCSSGSVFETLDPGTYYVMVAPAWTTLPTPCSNYRATVTCEDAPAGPINDSCSAALMLACNQTQTFDNINAGSGREDFSPLSCSLAGDRNGAASVWFKFIAGAATAVVSTCPPLAGGLIDPLLAVYRATNANDPCGSITEIGCSDDFCQGAAEVSLAGLTIGETYYVKVCGLADSTGMGPRTGAFNLRLTAECGSRCPDLDGDGAVGLQDMTLLLASFSACSGDPAYLAAGDLDESGCVDLADLALLLGRFGTECP